MIPLTLQFNGRSVKTFGLLDSGATVSLFRPEIGRALKIPFNNQYGQVLKLAKGKLNAMICEVGLRVGDVHFPAFIGFSRRHAASFNIIGRRGFFDHFGVYFNESKRRIGLAVKP